MPARFLWAYLFVAILSAAGVQAGDGSDFHQHDSHLQDTHHHESHLHRETGGHHDEHTNQAGAAHVHGEMGG